MLLSQYRAVGLRHPVVVPGGCGAACLAQCGLTKLVYERERERAYFPGGVKKPSKARGEIYNEEKTTNCVIAYSRDIFSG